MCARSTPETDTATGRSSAGSGIDASTAIRGAGAGAAAFVASYVVSFLLWAFVELPEPNSVGEAFNQAIIGIVRESVPAWQGAGYVLFNAQFVEVTFEGTLTESTFSIIALADSSLLALAYLVPALGLVAGGYAVSSSPGIRGIGQSAAAGALVVVGQLVLVVVGAVAFTADGNAGTLSVPLANAVILAGVVYPVVFGAIGGALAEVS